MNADPANVWRNLFGLMMQRHGLTEVRFTKEEIDAMEAAPIGYVTNCYSDRVDVLQVPINEVCAASSLMMMPTEGGVQ